MSVKKCFLICIVFVLFLSCFGNRKENVVSEQPEEASQNIPLSVEEIKELIYKSEEDIRRYNLEITFIEKANFGIPGGDNWVVRFNNRWIRIYAITGNRIERRFHLLTDDLRDLNIMQDIPGTHITGSTSSFGDFNGDGIDELFTYGFGGNAQLVIIEGYCAEKDDFVFYTGWIEFELLDFANAPAPVQFMTYRGMDGFKVYSVVHRGVAVGDGEDPSMPSNVGSSRWIFYTWDTEQRQYVEVGEVMEQDY